jgi:hypothetical protein
MANNENLQPFKKGYDPRRNVKGVPRDAVLMRQHMRKIAAELLGKEGEEMTRLDAMLRLLFTSRNPAHNKLALQVLDPKILEEVTKQELTGETKVIIEYADNNSNPAQITSGADTDKDAAEEI